MQTRRPVQWITGLALPALAKLAIAGPLGLPPVPVPATQTAQVTP